MTRPSDAMPAAACAAALANLPGMSPAILVSLLERSTPEEAWRAVLADAVRRPGSATADKPLPGLDAEVTGRDAEPGVAVVDWGASAPAGGFEVPPERARGRGPRPSWASIARQCDAAGWWDACQARGIEVTWWGDTRYPKALLRDPEPPGVVFWHGQLDWLERPCVALVGTRQATPDGRSVAFELGRDLAASGVCVISGLALGIDAAAHAGALQAADLAETAAGTVGVAASGVDVVYPRRNQDLWRRVVAGGAVISETPPGRPAQAWRFPARNRIIAGLVQMVVVVESHEAGGSLLTANAALERGVEVRAVPGSVHSPASAGSNQLLYDGPGPVRHAQDILDGLGDFRSPPVGGPPVRRAPSRTGGVPSRARPVPPRAGARPSPPIGPGSPSGPSPAAPSPAPPADERDAQLLDAVGWRPSSLAHVVERSGLAVGWAARRLAELEEAGEVTAGPGWWVRRDAAKASR